MKNPTRLKKSRAVRLASAALAATVAAGAAGIVAEPGNAAAVTAANASQVRTSSAELSHGLLTITGTGARDRIALRLKADHPGVVQVDIGDNGSADFSSSASRSRRSPFTRGLATTSCVSTKATAIFTDSIPTTIAGGDGRDMLLGGSGAETLRGGAGNDTIDGNVGNDLALMGAGNDTFVWDPGDGSDTI